MRARRSAIWKLPREEFRNLIDRSETIADAISYFDLISHGNTYRLFVRRAEEEGIDLSGIRRRAKVKSARASGANRNKPLDELLIRSSSADTRNVRIRLVKAGILENVCQICRMEPMWNELPLTLRLDHINGIRDDFRMGNLRLVCPNCDSQLDTYCGRNRVKNPRKEKNCTDCGKGLGIYGGTRCRRCNSSLPKPTKIDWPADDDLLAMVRASNKLQVSKNLGISEMALRRRLKQRCGVESRPYRQTLETVLAPSGTGVWFLTTE